MPETPISNITIGFRHRKDMGDIKALADSIKKQGLLQPIGITEDNELVFGARRLEACKLLGRNAVETRIVNVTSIIEGEYTENELRKNFTRSEQVAIAASIEELLRKRNEERRGNPNWKKDNDASRAPIQFPETEILLGKQTRDFVAERAGFGTGVTYQQAKKVVTEGTEKLITAMDDGKVSIKNAAVLARLPHEEQLEVLQKPIPEIKQTVKNLRKQYKTKDQDEPQGPKNNIPSAAPKTPEIPEPIETAEEFPPYTQAQQFATIALSHLEHILNNDPERRKALLRVRKWINEQLSKEKSNG